MKAILYGYFVASRADQLGDKLNTDWDLVSVSDPDDLERLRAELADADALVGNSFSEELRDSAGSLKLIHCTGAGVDAISLSSVPPGCTLCNVYEHEVPIAEHIMLTILLFVTRLTEAQERFRRGEWAGSGRFDGGFHEEVQGKSLGLMGYGHIGREVARRARAFGMRVAAVARKPRQEEDLDWYGQPEDLDRLIQSSDFLAIVCPLTEQTRGIIDESRLGMLKPSAYLINVARAEIVEEEPLYRALKQRWFAGAALDVWYQYPARQGESAHGSRFPFHQLDNAIITPHSSAWTEQLIDRRYTRIAENLDRLARGDFLDRVVYQAPVGVAGG